MNGLDADAQDVISSARRKSEAERGLCRAMTTKWKEAQTSRCASIFMSGAREIPLVAASETGRAQTESFRAFGVEDQHKGKAA